MQVKDYRFSTHGKLSDVQLDIIASTVVKGLETETLIHPSDYNQLYDPTTAIAEPTQLEYVFPFLTFITKRVPDLRPLGGLLTASCSHTMSQSVSIGWTRVWEQLFCKVCKAI